MMMRTKKKTLDKIASGLTIKAMTARIKWSISRIPHHVRLSLRSMTND